MPNVFKIYMDAGQTGLRVALGGLTVEQLKALCREYAIDSTNSYKKVQDSSQLVDLIVKRVKTMMSRGTVFMY